MWCGILPSSFRAASIVLTLVASNAVAYKPPAAIRCSVPDHIHVDLEHRERQLSAWAQSGGQAPFELTTYDDLVTWRDTTRLVIEERRMPPWYAEPRHGSFANSSAISEDERETLLSLPRWDFNWQHNSLLSQAKYLPEWACGTLARYNTSLDSAESVTNPGSA